MASARFLTRYSIPCTDGVAEACYLTGWLWMYEIATYRDPDLPGTNFAKACGLGFEPACPP